MNESKPIIKFPIVKIMEQDGNAFAIMGRCRRAAKKAGWDKDKIDIIMSEMMNGDYDNLLQTAMKYFDVQ